MKWDPSIWSPPRARHAVLDAPFICAVLAMFDAGADTAAIAKRMVALEGQVATALRMGREARRAA